jgi:hypothetical protein
MYGSCAKHGHDVLNAAGFAVVVAHVSGRVGQMFLQTSGAAGHLAAVAANLLSINVEVINSDYNGVLVLHQGTEYPRRNLWAGF